MTAWPAIQTLGTRPILDAPKELPGFGDANFLFLGLLLDELSLCLQRCALSGIPQSGVFSTVLRRWTESHTPNSSSLRLGDLTEQFGLTPFDSDMLLLCIALEVDPRTRESSRFLQEEHRSLPTFARISVRRLTLFIESSLYQSTQWAVFEPNDESLWSALRLSVNSFLAEYSRKGAFYNYLVTCDGTTTTPTGVVNILVQIAPVKPAEFVVITIQQTMVSASS